MYLIDLIIGARGISLYERSQGITKNTNFNGEAQNVDFTTLLTFVPDYAKMDTTSRGSTWTATDRGFVRLYSNGYQVNTTYNASPFKINGATVGQISVEAAAPNGARMGTISDIFPIAIGDVVSVIGGNAQQIYYIPGRWV